MGRCDGLIRCVPSDAAGVQGEQEDEGTAGELGRKFRAKEFTVLDHRQRMPVTTAAAVGVFGRHDEVDPHGVRQAVGEA